MKHGKVTGNDGIFFAPDFGFHVFCDRAGQSRLHLDRGGGERKKLFREILGACPFHRHRAGKDERPAGNAEVEPGSPNRAQQAQAPFPSSPARASCRPAAEKTESRPRAPRGSALLCRCHPPQARWPRHARARVAFPSSRRIPQSMIQTPSFFHPFLFCAHVFVIQLG